MLAHSEDGSTHETDAGFLFGALTTTPSVITKQEPPPHHHLIYYTRPDLT